MEYNMKLSSLLFVLSIALASCGGGVSESQSGGGTGSTITAAINLPKTGQTIQYAVGDDGSLQKGAEWPDSRFIDNGSTLTDRLTGLMWLKDGNCIATHYPGFDTDDDAGDGAVTWQHALDFVKGINAGTYSNCGASYNDWRLPNHHELRSRLHSGQANSVTWLSNQGFINVQTDFYWSSSTSVSSTDQAWMYSPSHGTPITKTYAYHVWPVRSTNAVSTALAKTPKTGQKLCYNESGVLISCTNTGQDGEIKAGVDWQSQRFFANADTTITDSLTGLIWMPSAETPARGTCLGGTKDWPGALDYVACLNTNNYLGHNDWRLPNINEMQSLVYISFKQESCGGTACENNTAWLNTQGFSNVQMLQYWSSTTYAPYSSTAWSVIMFAGITGNDNKTYSYYVWPVRGGQ